MCSRHSLYHKGSAVGNHLREQHDMDTDDIARSFKILRKCQNKFDCLIFEILYCNIFIQKSIGARFEEFCCCRYGFHFSVAQSKPK